MITVDRKVGQDEAWELAKKIICTECDGGLDFSQLKEIFGTPDFFTIMAQNSYVEAAEKVKAWEESKKIKVGDEYLSRLSETKLVITRIESDTLYVMFPDGSTGEIKPGYIGEDYIKTGRTLPVEDWLKQIGEDK